MTDRLAEQGAVQYAQNNPTSAGVSRLGAAGALQAAIADALSNGRANLTASRLGGRGRIYAKAAGAGPLFLFQNSEVGVWYDPSDLTSMFQDSAGTTAAVVGQPVGLMLDKSKGLVLGPELVVNGGFDSDSSWVKGVDWTIANGVATCTNSTGTLLRQNITLVPGRAYKIVVSIVDATINANIRFRLGTVVNQTNGANITTVILIAGSDNAEFSLAISSTGTMSFDNISVREIPGYHATQATTGNKPLLQQDAGGRYYLEFDGFDDFMVTPSIDFSGTDKMSVFAGVRKLSDAARGVIVELTTGTANRFAIEVPGAGLNNILWATGGSIVPANVSYVVAAPTSKVISAIGEIATDTAILRANGLQVAAQTTDQGTGNYSNAPLYIGMRAGTSLPFNGHLYSLIVRGALSDAAQIASAETFVNSKTGAY